MQLVDESGPNVKSSSTMIAIYPPMNFRRDMSRFADPDIGVEGLHQTLVYLGKLSLDEFDRAQQLLSALVRELPPIDMKVNGVGMFFNAKLVPYVTLSGVGLDVMRAKILMAFNGAKLKGVCSHGGVPHMTLGYYEDVYDDWWRMVLEEGEIDFNFRCSTVHLVRGDRVHIPFKLTGSLSVEGNPNIPM